MEEKKLEICVFKILISFDYIVFIVVMEFFLMIIGIFLLLCDFVFINLNLC